MRTLIQCATLALALTAVPALAGNAERGQEKSVVCQACHGLDGNGIGDPQYPILAGQYADYLEHAMRSYQTGERSDLIMQGFMATLNDQDIADLAAWYASQQGPLSTLRNRP